MAVVINPKNEEAHQLSKDEAWAFFDASVRERLGVSAEEFLKRQEEFKSNPHYSSLVIMLPLAEHESN
jgi:hypothetical protein